MTQPQPTIQPKDKRVRNFQEVSSGFSKRTAVEESRRCPQCSDPVCHPGCPLGIDIRGFIRLLREGDVNAALSKIKAQNPFPSICGRVCYAPCERSCVFEKDGAPIGIRALERFSADHGKYKVIRPKLSLSASKIAVVGSGPAGLTAAFDLARNGYRVKIFESLPFAGGLLRYGIPEFRLPARVLQAQIDEVRAMGVEIETGCRLGQTVGLEYLFAQGFAAALLALGATRPEFSSIPGNNLGGVFYAEEILMNCNLLKSGMFGKSVMPENFGNRVAVIGNTQAAMDCARVVARWEKDVTLVFGATEEEMNVYAPEIAMAKEEAVRLQPLTKVLEILPDEKRNFAAGIKCQHLDFADPDSTGKWQLLPVPDSEFVLEADTVVIALGKTTSPAAIRNIADIKLNADGTIWTSPETGMTSRPKIFAAGEVATGAGRLVDAMAGGKKAAKDIDRFLKSKS